MFCVLQAKFDPCSISPIIYTSDSSRRLSLISSAIILEHICINFFSDIYLDQKEKMGSDSEYGPHLYRYNARRYAFGPLTAQGQPSVTSAGLFYEDTMGLVMNLMTMVFSMGAIAGHYKIHNAHILILV